MSKSVYIYVSDQANEEIENEMQTNTLEELYGDEYVYIVCEDGAFMSNEEGTSVLVQEYF